MSEQHARRIQKIRQEYKAVQEAAKIGRVDPGRFGSELPAEAFELVGINADRTFYLRLCADVEGMLHRHLGDHFRYDGLTDQERATADELLEAVCHRLRPGTNRKMPIEKHLAARRAYAYRNRLAHGDRSRQAPVALAVAFKIFEDFLLELPDMID